jgi:outer membrane protein assembly factor BamA
MRSWPALLAVVALARAAAAQPAPPSDGEPVPPPDGEPVPPPDGEPAPPPDGEPAPPPDGAPPDDGFPGGGLAPAAPSGFELGDSPDSEFGPLILIEKIRVRGNRSTAERVIRRALPVAAGDLMRAGDPRLAGARFKLLSLGYFRDVALKLEKGSARGRVILTVTVSERGTIVLNRLWFGTSVLAPWWLGADLTERNLLGTGLAIGGGVAHADHGAVIGARDQWAGDLRLGASAIGGSRWGAFGAITGQRGAEPYRIGGLDDSTRAEDFRAFAYTRLGARGGARRDLRPNLHVDGELRVERIDADLPTAPTRTLPDGRAVAIDLGLRQGASRVVSVRFGLDRDTRSDPVLPRDGSRLQLSAELGATLLAGDYDFTALYARYERWWPVAARHSLGVRAAAGVILGEAPRFDRIHVADVDRLLTPRVLGMTVATAAPPDLLGTDNADVVYGDVGGNLLAEYTYRWFRRSRAVYGGDLFVAAGVWGLAAADELRVRDRALSSALPLDAVVDAGLRLDTELGVFEFTIANALGRVSR